MLFSYDQTFGTFLSRLQREHMFPLPLHSNLRSLQTSQQLNLYVICSTSNARIAQYALSSRSLDPAGEVVVDLQQLHPTFFLHLLFSFDFADVVFLCHPVFPLNQAVQTHR